MNNKLTIFTCVLALMLSVPARGQVSVQVSGPGGSVSRTLPDSGGSFAVNLPLNRNAVNNVKVTATDRNGNTRSAQLAVTQVSLEEVVVSKITAEPLSVEQVEQLVQDGTIKLDEPANYNVSQFTVVLTIEQKPVPVSVPIAFPKEEPLESGYEVYKLPAGRGDGGGPPKPPPDVQIIVFEQPVTLPEAPVYVPPVPGVIIIDGAIKSLKEFFSVRLMLMNTSGIFTLSDVMARIDYPDGGLSSTLPADGVMSFGSILPGTPDQPGQLEKEYIVRGDEVGKRRVRVSFGGVITGPGIEATNAIPFNGSAQTELEVKGPPMFEVIVHHPDFVYTNVPYDLVVDILNKGERPALYASLELDVGSAARIVNCTIGTNGTPADCTEVKGPVIRSLGHIMPAERISETFTVMPLKEGRISSCMGISDQNISLQVAVGNLGCVTGHYPPMEGVGAAGPTVTVMPTPNMQGIGVDSPVVAVFSRVMELSSIRTGQGGTFNVYNKTNALMPGQIEFQTIRGRTMAIWQEYDGIFNRLSPGEEYTVWISTNVFDTNGVSIATDWRSTFRTTTMGLGDVDPPILSMSIEPPVNPNYVLPGEVITVNAYPTDMGSGIARVELRIKDLDTTNALYALIDQKSVFKNDKPPYLFAIDSANLVPGHTYQLLGTAYDIMGNVRDATIAFVLASSADPPVIVLPEDPTANQLAGIAITLKPVALTGGVHKVRYYLDDATNAYKTVTVAPWQASLSTLTLSLTSHTIRAVAEDGLHQTGEDTYTFNLIDNTNMPRVSFMGVHDGAQIVTGQTVLINAQVSDDTGVRSVRICLDSPGGRLLSTNAEAFWLSTTNLSLGTHQVYVMATNNLGVGNDPMHADSYFEFSLVLPPPGPPPPAPTVTSLSWPVDGKVTFTGTSVANASIDVLNSNRNISITVQASAGGAFQGSIDADESNVIKFVAWNLVSTTNPSAPTVRTVPPVPILEYITLSPAARTFTVAGQYADLSTIGHYRGGWTSNLTAQTEFSSDNLAAASVNAAGRVVAIARGRAFITGRVGTNTALCDVFVDIVTLTNIVVSPPSLNFVAIGQTAQITVTGQYDNGASAPFTSGISFLSGDPSVATIHSSGLATARGNGQTELTVYRTGYAPAIIPVIVNTENDPPPTTQVLSPAPDTAYERGDTVLVSIRALDPTGGITRVSLSATGATEYAATRQISPSVNDTTQIFNFQVSPTATVDGVFTLIAWSEDTGGRTSDAVRVNLRIHDVTPPSVEITQPAPDTGFNYLSTASVVVAVSDAVGFTQAGVYMTGALTLSSNLTFAATTATNLVFNFRIPFGVPYPDVYLHAYAVDTSGRTGTAVVVPIILTDADITPPDTIVTSVADPGSGPSSVVTILVTNGLEDLDHVELFFRRNGIGTYNRYTDADGGHALGKYYITNGSETTILFNSTKMGGDGSYEFYSVGVDKPGNREPAPGVADVSRTFSAGTVWVWITNNLTIQATNTLYDDVNLAISNATVTLIGSHSFHNIELWRNGALTHPASTTTNEYGLALQVWTMTIQPGAAINVSALGYLGGERGDNSSGQGRTLTNGLGSTYRSGGSYGGPGGSFGGVPNPVYGNLIMPVDLGSGGSDGWNNNPGGNGGGRISLQAINVVNDGALLADGGTGGGSQAGSGSGGSIYLTVSTLSGGGVISSDGGAFETGGGGGRIAVHYVDMSTCAATNIQALGGQGAYAVGGNGTVFLRDLTEGGTLVVDGQGATTTWSTLPIPPGFIFENIVIRNSARVVVDDPLVLSNELSILNGSILTHSVGNTNGIEIRAANVTIDATSSIDVSGKGYRGGHRDGNSRHTGETLLGAVGSAYRSGGSYGGLGGVYEGSGCNQIYGSPYNPDRLGSGGSDGWNDALGGNGGGRITISAANTIRVNGALRADGQSGAGSLAGSGSGGSIKLSAFYVRGAGSITANGGAYEVGAGGGRIHIDYSYFGATGDDFSGGCTITAVGGKGAYAAGSCGSVVLQRSGQVYGDLYLDEGLVSGTSGLWTPFTAINFGTNVTITADTLLLDGKTTVLEGGLIGLKINPNINQATTFTIVDNTITSLTVDVSGGATLTNVAAVGDTYAGVYTFDNIYFRRGAVAVIGDQLKVPGELRIEENGVLTHYDARGAFASRLDIEAGSIVVASNCAINVNARGYLGGQHLDNPTPHRGQTTNFVAGSVYRSGGSYGGLGGTFENGPPNPQYGSLTYPIDLGSGGSDGWNDSAGGDGGGCIRIVADSMAVEGSISANGGTGIGNQSGSGSGGSILLEVGGLSGNGSIQANGGGYEVGGGGGRIAVHYGSLTFPDSHFETRGGQGSYATAGNGTLFLRAFSQALGDLIIDGHNYTTPQDHCRIPGGYVFENMIFRNRAYVYANEPLVVSNEFRLMTNSWLTHSLRNESGLELHIRSLEVDATSTIDVSGRGYRGGHRDGNSMAQGETLGGLAGATFRSGGSYGGLGGRYDGSGEALPYGVPWQPFYLGAGGSEGWNNVQGGNGGGRVWIHAQDSVLINGSVVANGASGGGSQSGSGAGGSVYIETTAIDGNGSISVNGGAYEVGAGGGRIGIVYSSMPTNAFAATRNLTAWGGKGSYASGSAGTVWLRQALQPDGDLYFDEGLGTTGVQWTPLTHLGFGRMPSLTEDTFVTEGSVHLIPNGLVGMWINPNTNQSTLFRVTANTATSITVAVTGGVSLTNVAAAGDTYVGVYRFDHVTLRRGTVVVLGDQLIVNHQLSIGENSVLTHHDATPDYETRLDIVADSFFLDTNGAVSVDARGYLGGWNNGNPYPQGQTTNHARGSAYRSGGSYGGLGGNFGGVPNPIYGSSNYPAALGSGGSEGWNNTKGGDGGGWIQLRAPTMRIDGLMTAGGETGHGGQAGSGSGGTIYLKADALTGIGTIRANGYGYEVPGGGGRVAIYCNGTHSIITNLVLQALAGIGSYGSAAAAGTVYLDSTFTGPFSLMPLGGDASGELGNRGFRISSMSLGVNAESVIRWSTPLSLKASGGDDLYVVEFTDALTSTNWTTLDVPVSGTSWTSPPTGEPQRFFRIRH
jgi:hypothetical protein